MLTVALVLALILLLVSGQDRLGAVGKGLGEGAKAFRKAWRERPPAQHHPVVVVSVEMNPPAQQSGEEAPQADDAAVASAGDSGDTASRPSERR